MNPTVTILESTSTEALTRWAALRDSAVCPNSFADLTLVSGLADAQQLDTRSVFVSQEGLDHAGFLATFRRVGPFSEVVPPRLVPFSPLLIRDHEPPEKTQLAVESLRSHLVDRYHRVVLTLPAHGIPLAARIGQGFKMDMLRTYVAYPQETPAEITTGWSAGTRRLYRKHRDAFDIREDASATAAILEMWRDAYTRSGKPLVFDLAKLGELALSMPPPTHCRVFAAERLDNASLEGGLVVLIDGSSAFYWIAGSIPGPAMTLLIGEVLTRLRSEGIVSFDFLGANTPSIAEFKRRFGPTLVEYPRLVTSRSRIFEAMLSAKQTLSQRTASL